jgi:hypothetical protein
VGKACNPHFPPASTGLPHTEDKVCWRFDRGRNHLQSKDRSALAGSVWLVGHPSPRNLVGTVGTHTRRLRRHRRHTDLSLRSRSSRSLGAPCRACIRTALPGQDRGLFRQQDHTSRTRLQLHLQLRGQYHKRCTPAKRTPLQIRSRQSQCRRRWYESSYSSRIAISIRPARDTVLTEIHTARRGESTGSTGLTLRLDTATHHHTNTTNVG